MSIRIFSDHGIGLLLTVCVASLFFCGCGGADVQPGNTLIYGRGGEADRLDPIHTDYGETVKVLVNLYDPLVAYDDETREIVPAIASKWTTSDDGLTWTFTIRDGVTFHDGTRCDAEAVVFSLTRLTRDDHPHVYDQANIPMKPNYAVIKSITATDDHTVVIQLHKPVAMFLQNMAMYSAGIVSPTAVKKYQKNFVKHPVGTGPFKLGRWKYKEELILEAFDDHWRGRPRIDRVIFVPVSESSKRVEQVRRGEIHMADNLPPSDVIKVAESPGITVQRVRGQNVAYLTMQTSKPPLDNIKVRHAIWHAINKQHLIEVAYGGLAKPAVTMVPPTIDGSHDGLSDRAFDIEKAKALMAEAQAESNFELPLKLTLYRMERERPYMPQPAQTANFIKDQLKVIGIDAVIRIHENSLHFQMLSRGEHQLGLIGWTGDNNDPDNFLYNLLHSDNINDAGGNNNSRFRNAEFDRLVTQAKGVLDHDARLALYRTAQQIAFDEAPVVPLVHTDVSLVQRSNVKGYKLHPSSLVRLRLAYFEDD